MVRFLVALSTSAVCLIAGGCSSVGRVGSVAWLRGFGGSEEAENSSKGDDPFASTRGRKKSPPGRSQYASANTHDAETLKYIHQELRDATPDERTALLDSLKTLKPSEVRIALRRRRLEISHRKLARQGQFTDSDRFVGATGVGENEAFGRQDASTDDRTAVRDGRSGRDPMSPSKDFGVAPWGRNQTGSEERRAAYSNPGGDSRGVWERDDRRSTAQRYQPGSRRGDDERRSRDIPPGKGSRYEDRRDGPRIVGGAGSPHGRGSDDRDRTDMRSSNARVIPTGMNSSRSPDDERPSRVGRWERDDLDAAPRDDGRRMRQDDDRRNPRRDSFDDRFRDSAGADSRRQLPKAYQSYGRDEHRRSATTGHASNFPEDWHETLERLIATTDSVSSRGKVGTTDEEQQEHIRRQVYLRMMYLMSGKPQQSIQAIEGIDQIDQKFWQDTFFGLATYLDPELARDPAARATRTAASLRKASEGLQENANLKIEQLAFCIEIKNFGNYQTYPSNEFRRGERVLVYAEIANFKSVAVRDNMMQTVLKSRIELSKVGATTNVPVKELKFEPTRDLCHNRRRDYFHSYEIEIPKDAGLGPHVLKLIVTDEQGEKVATDTINFTIK